MVKRAGRVGSGLDQSDHGLKRITGQNESFLSGLIGLRIKQVSPILPCLFQRKQKGAYCLPKKKKERKKERNCEIIFQYEERGLLIAIDYSSMK